MNDNAMLLERVQQGDKAAQDRLVEENMGLVWSIVRRFAGRGYELEELAQVGAVGLIKAVQKFDTSFAVKFSTYAVPMILGEIKRFLRDDGPVKVSRRLKENAMKGWRAEETLRRKYGREPTISEISKECDVAVEDLLAAFEAAVPPVSLQASGDGSADSPALLEKIPAADREGEVIDRLFINALLQNLEGREKQIVLLRYFGGKTQAETAEKIGVSQVQISRIEKAVLQKLRRQASGD